MNIKIIFKIILATIAWVTYLVSTSLFQTVLTNYTALNQLNDTITSTTTFQTYQQYSGAVFLIPFVFTLLLFATEIQKFINAKKGE